MFKSVLHVVLCVRYGGVVMYHGVGEERLLREKGGGGGDISTGQGSDWWF